MPANKFHRDSEHVRIDKCRAMKRQSNPVAQAASFGVGRESAHRHIPDILGAWVIRREVGDIQES
jgi:hypothetical protein